MTAGGAASPTAPSREPPASVGELALIKMLWPLLLIAFLGQLPPVASNLFVAQMAADTNTSVALLGGLRGLGGIAALATGVLAAPLIDRLPRAWAVAGGLVVIAGSALLAALGQLPTIVAFYLLVGSGGAVLLPSLQSAGGDGRPGSAGVRAATLLTSVPSLAAVVAGPVLALPAAWWGWRGDFAAMAVLSLLLALLAVRTLSHAPPPDVARPGYIAAFRAVGAAPGAAALLVGSMLRSTLFFGGLTYLSAYFTDRFALSLPMIGLIFSLGGSGFFLGNIIGGRLASRGTLVTPQRLLFAGLIVAGTAGPAQFVMPELVPAIALTVLHTAGHGAFLAGVVVLLIGRYPAMRGALMGLNVAGLNLGIFSGAAIGGAGLAAGGYAGLAVALALTALLALATTIWALRTPNPPAR